MSVVIRRQEHGIKAITLSVTLPSTEMLRLRREAKQQGITTSRHVVNLIRLAWSVQGALSAMPAPEREVEAVAS